MFLHIEEMEKSMLDPDLDQPQNVIYLFIEFNNSHKTVS